MTSGCSKYARAHIQAHLERCGQEQLMFEIKRLQYASHTLTFMRFQLFGPE